MNADSPLRREGRESRTTPKVAEGGDHAAAAGQRSDKQQRTD